MMKAFPLLGAALAMTLVSSTVRADGVELGASRNNTVVSDCVGDCDNSGEVTVDDMMTGINIALELLPVSACLAFAVDGVVTILELIQGVDNLLNGCPGGAFIDVTCTWDSTSLPDSPSRLEIFSAVLPPVPLPLNGANQIICDEFLGDGKYACRCQLLRADPTAIPGIGVLCINPGTLECPVGEIDCDGGNPLSVDVMADGNLADCMGNDECADQCDLYCVGLDKAVLPAGSGCTGYCSGGENNGDPCTTDADCPDGLCNGPDDGPRDICQCQCFDAAAGSPGAPGELLCATPIAVTIEAAPPCDGTDTIASFGQECSFGTTATVTDIITNANFTDGTVPTDGPFTATGMPLDCETLSAGIATGLERRAAENAFGSPLGDAVRGLFFRCQ